MSEYQNNYPVVLCHGFMGWGESDKIKTVFDYWGIGSKNVVKHLQAEGYEVHYPSLGPFASAWDRSCELWAYLFGGTVDYGKVHSERYHHKRYGRTYEHGAIEDLGKTEAHKKINILGHSFGGPTVKMFVELMCNGWEEEREATNPEDLSPLFRGGHGHLIHTMTTLDGVNNGTTLANIVSPKYDPIVKGFLMFMQPMENTPMLRIFDFGNQQFGLGAYPDEVHGIGINPLKKTKEGMQAYIDNRMDNIAYEMTVDLCARMNAVQGVAPNIYYFAQRGLVTHTGSDGKLHMDPKIMYPICLVPGKALCKIMPDNVQEIELDDSWWPHDGFVNLVGQSAPLNQPAEEGDENTDFRPGVWYNMKPRPIDHVFWMGLSGKTEDRFAAFDQMLDTYRRLPDGDAE